LNLVGFEFKLRDYIYTSSNLALFLKNFSYLANGFEFISLILREIIIRYS